MSPSACILRNASLTAALSRASMVKACRLQSQEVPNLRIWWQILPPYSSTHWCTLSRNFSLPGGSHSKRHMHFTFSSKCQEDDIANVRLLPGPWRGVRTNCSELAIVLLCPGSTTLPSSSLLMPFFKRVFSTMDCVAILAWSRPGSHRALRPLMRCQRVRASCVFTSNGALTKGLASVL